MAETRTYQGHTYTRSGPGESWTLVGPAQRPSAGVFVTDPRQPADVRKGAADAGTAEAQLPFVAPKAAADVRKSNADADAAEIKADADRRAAEDARRAEALKKSSASLENDIVLKNIREARDLIKNDMTSGAAAVLSVVPGTRARRLNAVFDTIRSNLTFDKLQQIRDESKTGASVGQATDNDMRLLGATAGSLDQYQKDTDLLNVLNDIERRYLSFGADNLGIDRELHSRRYHFPERAAEMFAQSATREQIDAAAGELGLRYGPDLDAAIAERDNPNVNVRFDGFGADGPSPAGAAAPGSYDDSFTSQGLSGVNEGIASTLGMPVDLVTSGLNLIPSGINAIANTDIGMIENPIGGGDWWRQRLAEAGTIGPESNSLGRPFLRRVGQSVGAAAIPVASTATTLGRAGASLLTAAGGGVGAATAREVAPGNPLAEITGEVIGSGATGAGVFGMAQRGARRTAGAAVPTVSQLKQQASGLYRAGEARGVSASQAQTRLLAHKFEDIAKNEGLISPTGRVSEAYPKAKEALRLAQDYAQGDMSPKQMQTVRKVLSDAAQSPDASEQRIATMMLREFDDFTAPLAPEFAQARGLYRRAMEGEEVARAGRVADTRSSANALRNEFATLERRDINGRARFSPDVLAAIDNVVDGTPASRALNLVGKMAPTGVVSFGLGSGTPFMIGNAIGGPALGGTLAAGSATTGTIARLLADKATAGQAKIAELVARNGGEIVPEKVLDNATQRMIAAELVGQAGQY